MWKKVLTVENSNCSMILGQIKFFFENKSLSSQEKIGKKHLCRSKNDVNERQSEVRIGKSAKLLLTSLTHKPEYWTDKMF